MIPAESLSWVRAGVRPVPLDIHIMGFDIVNFDARLQAMARPTYTGLVNASTKVSLVWGTIGCTATLWFAAVCCF